MDNSRFSNLLYQIIGKPESWQDEYVDITNKIVDEIGSFDDSEMFSELAIGDRILSRMQETNEALSAFSALLDKSRFKLIILDSNFKPIYHNQNARELHDRLLCTEKSGFLNPKLLTILNGMQHASQRHKQTNLYSLTAVDYTPSPLNSSGETRSEQIYLRAIKNQSAQVQFNVLLMLDQSRQTSALNSDLTARYELTDKEQAVLINLIHGKSIKTISCDLFVSENTVKTHLKSLFRKTNTKSQTDLVGLILTHESQVLDSYFDTAASPIASVTERAKDRLVVLNDGTEIAYREYGPSDGYPIIVCHNGYGCRITIPSDHEQICSKHKRRVIIPDRPGFGQTPFVTDHPKCWSEQLNEFINELKIDEYDLLGSVLGCPIAINFAVQADQRLKRLILSSPVFINSQKDSQYMQGILSPSARLVKASERFARETYQLWLKSISLNLGSHYRNMAEASLGAAERKLFVEQNRLEETLDLMVDSFREGISNTLDGISNEMVFCMSARNLDLSTIEVPVILWWGSEDNRISRDGVQNLAAQFKDSTIHLKEGYSEHIYYACFEEMIA